MSVKLRESLTGALVDSQTESKSGKRWRVKVIEAGKGSSAIYPEDVLRDYASVFESGTQMYLDHPTSTEESDRPERSVRDLVGRLVTEAKYEDGALYAEAEFLPWAAPVIEAMSDMVGLSIRAYGTVTESDDGPVLTAFSGVESVDVVTRAGAGGKFVELLESARPIESVTEQKENRMTPEQEAKLDQLIESMSSLGDILRPVAESLSAPAAGTEEGATTETVDALEAAKALAASDLSEAGQAMAVARVSDTVTLAEAIKAQKEYEDSVKESAATNAGVHVVTESKAPVKVPFKKVGA